MAEGNEWFRVNKNWDWNLEKKNLGSAREYCHFFTKQMPVFYESASPSSYFLLYVIAFSRACILIMVVAGKGRNYHELKFYWIFVPEIIQCDTLLMGGGCHVSRASPQPHVHAMPLLLMRLHHLILSWAFPTHQPTSTCKYTRANRVVSHLKTR